MNYLVPIIVIMAPDRGIERKNNNNSSRVSGDSHMPTSQDGIVCKAILRETFDRGRKIVVMSGMHKSQICELEIFKKKKKRKV